MNILINGGSRGIGSATALYLSQDVNNRIIITGRNEAALKKICGSARNKNISYIFLDLSEYASSEQEFFLKTSEAFNKIDILINNAGSLYSKKFLEISDEKIRLMMETNFFGPASVIRTLFPLFVKGSHIINISSMGGFQGSVKFSGLSYYSATKAAMACMTECLAAEFSEYGISVNCLALGSVDTEMLQKAFPGYKASVSADEMGRFIADFAFRANKIMNGKIVPVALSTP